MAGRKPRGRRGVDAGPLDRVLSLWACRGGSLTANEFLYLGSDRIEGLVVHVYKHRRSRRCLNLDEAGHAYVFVPSGDRALRTYRPLKSFRSAVIRLELDARTSERDDDLGRRDRWFQPGVR